MNNTCNNCKHKELYGDESPCNTCSFYNNWKGKKASSIEKKIGEVLSEKIIIMQQEIDELKKIVKPLHVEAKLKNLEGGNDKSKWEKKEGIIKPCDNCYYNKPNRAGVCVSCDGGENWKAKEAKDENYC